MAKPSEHADTPFHINFEQQKKRAKELRDDLRLADKGAIDRFKHHHPKSAALSSGDIVATLPRLSEAQLVIAREFGLASWAKLKMHAAAMETAGMAIKQKEKSPDAELETLHIRCGTDLQLTLPAAGFVGSFLEYSNPFCQGPVIDGPDMVATRADFLSRSYELHSVAETLTVLQNEEDSLTNAAHRYERVVLWFEHDSYDQLILIRILAFLAQHGAPNSLELVDLDHFPGSVRFIGLGQLPPEAIRMLWSTRKPVTPRQLSLGREAWDALRASSPTALAELASAHNLALPNLSRALKRHLQELPSTLTGLGLTEHLILEILGDGNQTAGQIFRALMRDKEPLPWLGDLMFWFILRSMGQVSTPVFEVVSQNDHPGTASDPLVGEPDWMSPHPPRELAITDAGRAVLSGRTDWLSLSPPDRWLGGMRISAHQQCWRWDRDLEKPVYV